MGFVSLARRIVDDSVIVASSSSSSSPDRRSSTVDMSSASTDVVFVSSFTSDQILAFTLQGGRFVGVIGSEAGESLVVTEPWLMLQGERSDEWVCVCW